MKWDDYDVICEMIILYHSVCSTQIMLNHILDFLFYLLIYYYFYIYQPNDILYTNEMGWLWRELWVYYFQFFSVCRILIFLWLMGWLCHESMGWFWDESREYFLHVCTSTISYCTPYCTVQYYPNMQHLRPP